MSSEIIELQKDEGRGTLFGILTLCNGDSAMHGEDLPRTPIVGSLAEQADHFVIGQTLLPLCFLTSFPFFPQAAGQSPMNILEPGNSRENQLNSFLQP